MEDFERLLLECHNRDLKVIMDIAVNHTSTKHPWFQEAISSPNSPYRDYYIIRKGKQKNNKLLPPTNWESAFTGSAWEQIGNTDEFYLHLFCKEQADLNWENSKVRQKIADILNFWLEKGVDGDDTITMDKNELKVAEWRKREDIELQPVDISLTNEMMSLFKEGKDPV